MNKSSQHHGRRMLVLIAFLFIGPLVLAWTLYLGGLWRPGAGANHGELLQPVISLPRDPQPTIDGGTTEGGFLYGRWTLVHLIDGECDEACVAAVYKTRQVRLALGREIERIDRVLFLLTTSEPALGTGSEDLLIVTPMGSAGTQIIDALNANGGTQRIFLVDPLGNLILGYPRDGDPADIRDDLKKLLRLSRIG
ncbi:MAG: hypothetical protein OEQ74_04190 [Gammaproteobacteria bacterium]|nr:hypothetical protein [Gammaproteobacteria bacterium]